MLQKSFKYYKNQGTFYADQGKNIILPNDLSCHLAAER
jgi:hypothetical protein